MKIRVLLMGEINIKLNQLVSALSLSLDLAENRVYEHGRRTAYIVLNILQALDLKDSLKAKIYYSALLHDIGMAGALSYVHINNFHDNPKFLELHCELGYEIAKQLPFDEEFGQYILYHHERWDGKGADRLQGDQIPIGSQLIFIADRFDIAFCTVKQMSLFQKKLKLKEWLDSNRSKLFNPEYVDILLYIMEKDSFWLDLNSHELKHILYNIEPEQNAIINIEQLEKISNAFGVIVDNKSNFTFQHSAELSHISGRIAKHMGYSDFTAKKIKIAANLHDLGKLAIPNDILDKKGKLNQEEFTIIKSHPYYTKLILDEIEGIEDISEWAANHHEKLNGQGYPRRLNNENLTDMDQIIAVSDIYQALIQRRPYRDSFDKAEALDIIEHMVKDGLLSSKIYNALREVV